MIVVGIVLFIENTQYINDLKGQVTLKDERIEALKFSDSSVAEATKEYSNTITKYIKDCNVDVDGKTFTFDEFIDLYISEVENSNKIKDSLRKLSFLNKGYIKKYGPSLSLKKKNDSTIIIVNSPTRADTALAYLQELKSIENESTRIKDSLQVYRSMVHFLEKKFEIHSYYDMNNKSIKFGFNGLEKIDSALFLLPYYRHRLTIDSTTVTVEVDQEYLRNERRAKRAQRKNKN